jgi:hypothetical protein
LKLEELYTIVQSTNVEALISTGTLECNSTLEVLTH